MARGDRPVLIDGPGRSRRSLRALLLAAAFVSGCGTFGGAPVPSGAVLFTMVNATSVPIALYVNDAWMGTFPAWSQQRDIPVFGNGGPPWRVRFDGPRGFPVASLDLQPGRTNRSEWSSHCGVFVAWSGAEPPDVPVIEPGSTAPPPPREPCP